MACLRSWRCDEEEALPKSSSAGRALPVEVKRERMEFILASCDIRSRPALQQQLMSLHFLAKAEPEEVDEDKGKDGVECCCC